MKKGWTYKKVGDVFKTYSGGTPIKSHKEYYENGDIPWIRSGEICRKYITESEKFITRAGLENSSAKFFPVDTVLVAMYGATAAQVGILKIKATSNQAVCGILPNENFISEFVYYWFKLIESDLASQAQGGAQPNISQEKIKKVEFPIISLSEQERIVERLDAAFAQIDELKSNAERQLAEARNLFQSVILIAFTPKAGWKSVKLGDICKVKSGSSTANNSSSGNLPYVKVADMNMPENSEFITTSTRFVDRDENEKGIFPVGSVIFPKRGGAILTNKKRLTKVEICCDLNIMGLVSKDTTVLNNDFLFQWFKQFDLSSVTSGTTVLQLNNCDITPVNIALPPLSIQKSIVDYLNDFSTRIRILEDIINKTLAECDAMKQALLRQIFE